MSSRETFAAGLVSDRHAIQSAGSDKKKEGAGQLPVRPLCQPGKGGQIPVATSGVRPVAQFAAGAGQPPTIICMELLTPVSFYRIAVFKKVLEISTNYPKSNRGWGKKKQIFKEAELCAFSSIHLTPATTQLSL